MLKIALKVADNGEPHQNPSFIAFFSTVNFPPICSLSPVVRQKIPGHCDIHGLHWPSAVSGTEKRLD